MKTKILCALMAVMVVFAAGCAQPVHKEDVGAGEKHETPADIAKAFFNGFVTNDTSEAAKSYSARIPASYVEKYLKKRADKEQLLGFDIVGSHVALSDATVDIRYSFHPVLERGMGLILRTGPEQSRTERMIFVREGKDWRIAQLGDPELDGRIEKAMFYKCLNAVMDARVAEERYKAGHGAYTSNLVNINEITPIQIDACRELRIVSAEENDYVITATTHNTTPCEITAGANEYLPRRYGGCPGYKPTKAPAPKKAAKAVPHKLIPAAAHTP